MAGRWMDTSGDILVHDTQTTTPKIGTVLINFNSYVDVRKCIESLQQIDYEQSQILCVDNGSTDDSRERLMKEFPEVVHIDNGGNLGFGAGMNTGIQKALESGCDYVFCFNSDTWVDDRYLFDRLLAPFREDEKMGVTGPVEYDYSGASILYSGPRGLHKFEQKVAGAAFFVSKRVFESVGLLDDRFFLGYEDQDLFIRAERHGYHLKTVPDARFLHRQSAFISRHSRMMAYLEARNEIVYYTRHWDVPSFIKRVVIENCKRIPSSAISGMEERRSDIFIALVRGVMRGISYMPRAKQPDSIPPFDPSRWMTQADNNRSTAP
ncbi:MAG: glycosyltransferase family 2 protein [Thermoplasmata archaeon]|nr:glycosyltransferase family 2 protein [Thermoplasmata archaeon]